MSTPVKLTTFAAVFTVSDVAAAHRFYLDKLGFRSEFTLSEPMQYAIIERDQVQLHLMPAARAPESLGRSSIYVFAAGVDALHEELKGRGCAIEVPPRDFDYGMRETSVRDADGNRITFGEEVKK